MKMECNHKNFNASVNVNRLVEKEGDETPNGYMADIRISCADCGEKFHFVGVDCGLSPHKPTVEIGGCELRVPIASGELNFIPNIIEYAVGSNMKEIEGVQ